MSPPARSPSTWRLWKYPHVKVGKVYATGFGGALDILDVRAVSARDITDADAREAGHADAGALIEFARSHTGATVMPDTLLYRVKFRYLPVTPEKPVLPLDEIAKRVARLDQASPRGPWTEMALRLIEEHPGVAARRLAAEAGWETRDFKVNVRKLKSLGLTISLTTGYELSETGQAYLDTLPD